jgi:hypothetical protein
VTEWFNVFDFRSIGCASTFVSPNLTSSARACSLAWIELQPAKLRIGGSNPPTLAKFFRIVERGKNQPCQVDDIDPFQYSTKTELSFFPYKRLFPIILTQFTVSYRFISFILLNVFLVYPSMDFYIEGILVVYPYYFLESTCDYIFRIEILQPRILPFLAYNILYIIK